MRGTRTTRLITSLGLTAALAVGAVACGSDGEATDTTPTGVSAPATDPSTAVSGEPAVTAGTVTVTAATVAAETGTSETAAGGGSTDQPEPTQATTASSSNTTGTSNTAVGGSLDEYIASLAATTDQFDGLAKDDAETQCAASAIITPIGLDALQASGVSVEGVNDELDLTEILDETSAAGIADGLVACGIAPRFAASFAQGEVTDDLDETEQLALLDCVEAGLDDATARSILVAYLTPITPNVQPQDDAAALLAGLATDCGFTTTTS